MKLTHLSLFSGIGGLDIAAEMAGFETVGQCEWADYPTKVLEKHWPDVPRWRDIRTLTGENFYERTGLRTVNAISGGFPCQPFSLAGQRKGTADDRYLWPEMLRVVSELRPTWVVGENVAGLVSMVKSVSPFRVEGRSLNRFEDADHYEAILSRQEDMLLVSLIGDIERLGYSVQAFVIPACAVGASHRRDRVALVAHNTLSRSGGLSVQPGRPQQANTDTDGGGQDVADADCGRHLHWRDEVNPAEARKYAQCEPNGCSEDVADATLNGLQRSGSRQISRVGEVPLELMRSCGGNTGRDSRQAQPRLGGVADGIPAWMDGYWLTEPDIPRVAAGVLGRVDKLKALGNAVYWRQFYPIFKGIRDIEKAAP